MIKKSLTYSATANSAEMSNPRPDSPDFDFCDDGGRPRVVTYITSSKFRTGDRVYLTVGAAREGPYVIATVPSAGRYTLCLENGQPANNGAEVAEHSIVFA